MEAVMDKFLFKEEEVVHRIKTATNGSVSLNCRWTMCAVIKPYCRLLSRRSMM